jgi:hypothetical protein
VQIVTAEAMLEKWDATPDVDVALDFYSELLDVIQGRIRDQHGPDLNQALASVLAGLWCELVGDRLRVEFALRNQPGRHGLPAVHLNPGTNLA